MSEGRWTRLKRARLFRVVLVYLGASWGILQVAELLQDSLSLPDWVTPVAILLLLVGLVIVLATAWVQASPLTDRREEAGEVPGSWELELGEVGRSLARGKLPHLTWGRTILGGLVAFWFLFGLAGLYVLVTGRAPTLGPGEVVADEAPAGIAVVPFTVRGADLDVWREGMMDLFTTGLDGVGGVRTIDSRTVLARWREAVGGEAPDLDLTLKVARATGARYALVGTAVSVAGNVRLAGELYDLETGAELGRARVEGPPEDVLDLVDRLSVKLMGALLAETGGGVVSESRIASITTASLPALEAYLEGEAAYRRSDFRRAAEAYQRAVAQDSTFALALLRLGFATAYSTGYDYVTREADEYLERAARHSDRLPARDAELVRTARAYQHGEPEALALARQLVEKYPDDADAWAILGEVFMHSRRAVLEDPAEGTKALEKAVELDPTFAPYYIHLIELAIVEEDTARAFERLTTYQRLARGSAQSHLALAVPIFVGDSAQRTRALAALDTVPVQLLDRLYGNLDWQTRSLEIEQRLLAKLVERADPDWPGPPVQLVIARGRYRAAMDSLRADGLSPWLRAPEAFVLSTLVKPVPAHLLDRWLTPDSCAVESEWWLRDRCMLAVGAYAADRGRWDTHARIIKAERARGDEYLSAGDSAAAAAQETVASALEGYGLLRRGRPDAAIQRLQAVQGRKFGPDHWVRWWLGEAYAAAGQPDRAIRYFRSLWLNRFKFYGAYRLGGLYEQAGQPQQAREAYASFLRIWKDADADLPQLGEARSALERLSRDTRTAEAD